MCESKTINNYYAKNTSYFWISSFSKNSLNYCEFPQWRSPCWRTPSSNRFWRVRFLERVPPSCSSLWIWSRRGFSKIITPPLTQAVKLPQCKVQTFILRCVWSLPMNPWPVFGRASHRQLQERYQESDFISRPSTPWNRTWAKMVRNPDLYKPWL